MNVIEIENIRLKRGNTEILENISFHVKDGEIFGLIGHNGAGKTSLLRILLGLTVEYQGKIRLFENDNLSQGRAYIGTVMDSLRMDENITAEKYMYRVSGMFGRVDKEYVHSLMKKVGLHEMGKKKIKVFSLGMKRRLEIAVSLVGKPKLLILDEPFNGIDSKGMAEIRLLLQQLTKEGITILITSHIIPELLKLSTTYGIMYQGKYRGTYSKNQLQCFNLKKTIFKTEQAAGLVEKIAERYPEIYCTSDAMNEISVLGDIPQNLYFELGGSECEICHEKAKEDDVLFWKMNGFGE